MELPGLEHSFRRASAGRLRATRVLPSEKPSTPLAANAARPRDALESANGVLSGRVRAKPPRGPEALPEQVHCSAR